ncbi:MAG: hypothetical protein NZM35_02595 [Chitinophagales bacterium]|nr:hypothetical protein [Chitinophagales bacterium]MDW8419809.1 hypothetical protein [Chitinophagales bacterium]
MTRLLCFLCLTTFLFSCTDNRKKIITGRWYIKELQVQNTAFTDEMFPNWRYEFLPDGRYVSLLAGADTGIWTLRNNTLELRSTLHPGSRPAAFHITALDTSQMVLCSTDSTPLKITFYRNPKTI